MICGELVAQLPLFFGVSRREYAKVSHTFDSFVVYCRAHYQVRGVCCLVGFVPRKRDIYDIYSACRCNGLSVGGIWVDERRESGTSRLVPGCGLLPCQLPGVVIDLAPLYPVSGTRFSSSTFGIFAQPTAVEFRARFAITLLVLRDLGVWV